MVFNIVGKGDLDLLPKFKKNDFDSYELYLNTFNEEIIRKKLSTLPDYIKISSIHNPTNVEVSGKKHPFDLSNSGKIGAVSLLVLKKVIHLAKEIGSGVVVIHGATYNVFEESKSEAMQRVADRIIPLLNEKVQLCFETDVLWHNLFYHRRALLTNSNDFSVLNNLLNNKLKIVADIEHLTITFYFSKFITSLGGEELFMEKYSEISQKSFEIDFQKFILANYEPLQLDLQENFSSFFEKFKHNIELIHLNGSDCKNYKFNSSTTLPLIGEHLPLGFNNNGVEDRINYSHLITVFKSLPVDKNINIVLEVWRTEPNQFFFEMIKSKKFLTDFLSGNMHDSTIMNCQDNQKNPKNPKNSVTIANKKIENFSEPFTIAEIGSNHNGSIELGKKMIDAAVQSGADCAKFQAFDIHLFSSICYEDDERRQETITKNKVLEKHLTVTHKDSLKREMQEHVITKEMLKEFHNYCTLKGISFLCTPLNKESADFLIDELGMQFIKIASMDLNNLPFLTYLAKKNRPMILSTGMSTFQEILEAVNTIEAAGNTDIIILHCVSLYPPKDNLVNLNNLDMLRDHFAYPIGFSDHSFGTEIPLAAIAKGACVIEKHFTLDKTLPGWDHKVSANSEEMKTIVQSGKKIWRSLGSYHRILSQEEKDKKALFGRSIVIIRDIQAGETIKEEDIDYRRPGIGIEPKFVQFVIGRVLKNNLKEDTLIKFEDLV
tara:strand:+ start:417 stop:2567 length:2151 start_codon:yes stop_codon:yes gene_type:complete